MKTAVKYVMMAASLWLSVSVNAQNLESAYFLDGFAFGHELNPAKDYDRKGYVHVPILGQVGVGIMGNLGLNSVFKDNPNGSGLVTYLDPNLSDAEALKGLKDSNKLFSDNRIELLGFGFHAKHSFQTFNLSMRTNVGLSVPGDLFCLTRKLENRRYDLRNLGLTANAWVEAGWGMSRDIKEGIRVGGKAKLLFGAGYADVKMDNLLLDLESPDQWTISANATAEVGVKGFQWGESEKVRYSDEYLQRHPEKRNDPYYNKLTFEDMDVKDPGLGGMGVAFDLGTDFDFGKLDMVKGLRVGAAVTDLGFIKWKHVAKAINNGDALEFKGFDTSVLQEGVETPMEDQLEELGDRLQELVCVQDGGTAAKTRALGATLNVSAEYDMPFYDKLSVGLLSTTHFQGNYTWNEERLALTVSPTSAFEAAVSAGVGTAGASFGWVINVHPRGFNLFLGMDHLLSKMGNQGVPQKTSSDFFMGVTIPFGRSRFSKVPALGMD